MVSASGRERVSAEQRELAAEQAYVDSVYSRLDAAAESARALAADGHARARVGNDGGLVERDAMVFQAARRLAVLEDAAEGLVFGRLDLRGGEIHHIGRIGLRDEQREVLLIDWRAPAAARFYQATARDPHDVVRRRVLRCREATVVSLDDELLDADAAPDDMVVVGEGALMAELSRARDTVMHSVVATIQKEQDDAIRAPARGVTTIGGGPGTGKTVVALHRAAYLLYSDRRRFETGGVLVVGPSPVFMRYIERVLPSLGETAVTLRAIGEVVNGLAGTRHDPPAVSAVKGSQRMVRVLERAARDAVPGAPTEFRTFYRDDVVSLDRRQLRRLRHQLLQGQQRNPARRRVPQVLLDAMWDQVGGERTVERGADEFADRMRDDAAFEDFVQHWWPPLDAVDVLAWLRDERRLRHYADGVLAPAEVDALLQSWRAGDAGAGDAALGVEDVALVDELRYLLGDRAGDDDADEADPLADLRDDSVVEVTTTSDRRGVPPPRPTSRVEDDRYAHVLVDEAQDLSPMQWRMLGRRGRHASWTVVGDPAQSAWPLPGEAAAARAHALDGLEEHRFRLSTNYRNSAEIFALAAAVVRRTVPDPDLPEAVRRTGAVPEHRVVSAAALPAAVRQVACELLAAVDGTVGVIVPAVRRDEVAGWLGDVGGSRLHLLQPLDTKGLEFDAVVVVEPGEIAAESPGGPRTLYVVLTRATQRLTTVGTDDAWRP
ncbi:MAG: AAA family ATPase [Actinomycetota bacterium]|nr:AAA family ATPase [Actinomycetota bacterium]